MFSFDGNGAFIYSTESVVQDIVLLNTPSTSYLLLRPTCVDQTHSYGHVQSRLHKKLIWIEWYVYIASFALQKEATEIVKYSYSREQA